MIIVALAKSARPVPAADITDPLVAEIREKITASAPDWKEVLRALCRLEGEKKLTPEVIKLFGDHCPEYELIQQVREMVLNRQRIELRTRKG